MKPYPKYKDSSIEWIGEIPEHWDKSRIKFDTYLKGRVGWHGLQSSEFIDEGAYLVTGTDFVNGSINWDSCYHISDERYDEDPFIQLSENDLLITKDGTIGKVAIVKGMPYRSSLNSGIMLIRPLDDKYSTNYMKWLLQSSVFKGYIENEKTGTTINHLYQETFGNMPYTVPLVSEQIAIASYLDHKTQQIDTLIEKTQKMIELLKEYRTAVINHAVTKGLNPKVKMKDSGIEWLGEIPEHWKVKRLKHICQVNPTKGASSFSSNSEEFVTFLPMEKVNENGSFDISEKKAIRELWNGFTYFEEKDTIIAKITPCFENGKGAYLENLGSKIGFGSTEFHVLRGLVEVSHPKYLYYLSFSAFFRHPAIAFMTGAAGQKRVPSEFIEEFHLGVPTYKEQMSIADYLDLKTGKIDSQIEIEEQSIERLMEYRTALISNTVTGKIDVRNN